MTQALDAVPGLLAWHRRTLARGGSADLLDHLVASRAGGFLIEERDWPGSFSIQDGSLVRHRMGPGGQWARGAEDARLDPIRRTAETVESIIGRPVEPVLVLTGGATAFTGPVQLRGVLVLHLVELPGWLAALPALVDRAEVVLISARMERAFRSADAARRIPNWQVHNAPSRYGRGRATRGPVPLRTAPGPRDYSLPALIEPAPRAGCVPAAGAPRSRGRAGSVVSAVSALGVVLTLLWVSGILGGLLDRFGVEVRHPPEIFAAQAPVAAPPAVDITSCAGLSPDRLTTLLGQTVHRLPGASNTTCDFGPTPADPGHVLVSVATGPDALAPRTASRTPMWTLTYHAGGAAPDGSGRVLAGPICIGVDPALYAGDSAQSRALAETVAGELVTGG